MVSILWDVPNYEQKIWKFRKGQHMDFTCKACQQRWSQGNASMRSTLGCTK